MQYLDIFGLHLLGSHLIEASAGTGKTYSITELYLRALLYHLENPSTSSSPPIEVKSILVLTFTKAATSELFDRIRQRIYEVLGAWEVSTSFGNVWCQRFGKANLARACLHKAKEDIDQAQIRTIDAWCQQILREYSWYSQISANTQLCTDEESLWQEALLDYWREECYTLNAQQFAKLCEIWPQVSPKELEKSINAMRKNLVLVPHISGVTRSLSDWLEAEPLPLKKKPSKPPETLITLAFNHIAHKVSARKIALDSWTYNDYLQKVNDLLCYHPELIPKIRQKYPIVMIDEFQDTSKLQYEVFNKIYAMAENRSDCGLFMIGDPKQSIYAFRGADIDNYLLAKQAVNQRIHHLATNFRSSTAVVDMVNHWFAQGDVINQDDNGAFGYQTKIPFLPVEAHGTSKNWTYPALEHAPLMIDFIDETGPRKIAEKHSAQRCAEQIVTWLNHSHCGFTDHNHHFESLQPKDIAILVKTGDQADLVRQALKKRGLSSIYLSERESVFHTVEAKDLYSILLAVLEPYHPLKVRAALLSATIGYDFQTLNQHLGDDTWLQKMQNIFYPLLEIWQKNGVMAMLWQLIHQLDLLSHWQSHQERKLTNLLHLGRLMRRAQATYTSPLALVNWYAKQVFQQDGLEPAEEHILRLESDANLVQILTIHKSKGLQFNVVALPFLPFTDLRKKDTTADMREMTRLWYVALTRAKIALWV
ncbi:MAG: UvrD-helicase domain-containing protein, partial [Gammaproteobacteria bacterium]|nr:UvrD-helicase domain-containing protein [Gammaproteobacteria bacterium]